MSLEYLLKLIGDYNASEMWLKRQRSGVKRKSKSKESKLQDALIKKALGYDTKEVVEEYIDDGEKIRLSKKKITTKNVPPDMSAIKLLLMGTDNDYLKMSDEELEREKERLIASIKDVE